MALSYLAVRQTKATGKAYTLPDTDGLSLAVTTAGDRTWHFRYYWAGKQKRMSLGTYPEVTLREAAAYATKRAPCWPKAPILAFTASRSALLSGSPTKTPSRWFTAGGSSIAG